MSTSMEFKHSAAAFGKAQTEKEYDHIYSTHIRGSLSLTPMPFSIKKKRFQNF